VSKSVELDVSCVVGGKTWNLYSFHYHTGDGVFTGYLHAVSSEHASYMLQELRETATLDGQVLEAGKL